MGEIEGLTEGDVDLLARGADVEPGEGVALEGGHGAGGQAEGVSVKGCGGGEGEGGDHEVYVVDAGDHCCGAWGGPGGRVVR